MDVFRINHFYSIPDTSLYILRGEIGIVIPDDHIKRNSFGNQF